MSLVALGAFRARSEIKFQSEASAVNEELEQRGRSSGLGQRKDDKQGESAQLWGSGRIE